MNIRRSIITGTIANSAGIGMNAFIQIVTVPVLATAWGAEKYGVWVMLTTIPTYFALTDLGFVQAATSDMTMKFASNKKEEVLATFQSIWWLFAGSSFLIVLLSSFLKICDLPVLPLDLSLQRTCHQWLLNNADIIILLIAYSATSLLSRVTLAGFRSTGHYAIGSITYDILVLLESLCGLLTAHLGGSFTDVALTLLSGRIISMGVFYYFLRIRVHWLYIGTSHASMLEIKRLIKPALGALAIPIALAINLQGVILVIGAILSPAAVAIYTPVRTASRLLIQAIGVVNRATMPEIGKAIGTKRTESVKTILRINGYMMALVLIPGGVLFAIFGKNLIQIWSHGQISPDTLFVELMALVTMVHGSWYFVSNLLVAINLHVLFSRFVFFLSPFSLILAVIFGADYGLDGVATSALIVESVTLLALVVVLFFCRNAFSLIRHG